ncbi:hypothetical protein Glove_243g103 [Diversispora epigaea]|uniref:Uncharacterized protein n=1 Tax=Diversispora epigaea TaxID=1348612 RepID=A0A397IDE2_9GLOM|nr:hypothetical protein Glove_243g103 [Diversispora epigaea]
MSNLNALFSTNSKASESRASANRVSKSTSRAFASTAIFPRLISQFSGSSIQSFESDNSITPLSSVSNVIIKKSSEELIEHSIYSISGDYKEMAEEVLRKTNNNFFLSLSNQWDSYFEKKMKKAAKIENTSEKYIVYIIKNAWPKKEFIPDSHTTWCVSIAEILLNPNNEYIQITEDVVQSFVEKNLKKIENKIGFNNDSDLEEIAETFERKRKNQMNNDTELPTLGKTQARLEKAINKKKMKQTVTLRKSPKKDDNGDDDNNYNNNNNNDYNNDDYNNNNNNYNDYNNNNVNNEDDFQIIEDDRRFTNN